ncbi:MAG TPA: hypothetical protein ENJ18_00545, partial [Nannocystis exedens]|nr:hypothetical protein [Nannocystis exedens]
MFIQLCLLVAGLHFGRRYANTASKPARDRETRPSGAGERADIEEGYINYSSSRVSEPVKREVGDCVYAATMVSFGRVHVRVETTGEETVAAEVEGALARTAEFTSTL